FPTTWACSGLTPVRARPWRANKEKAESKDTQRYLPSAFGMVTQKQKAMDKTLSIASYTL
ncbi:hypothetical protein, partial [Dorea formicigenerans]|uniref:hypothetical protein n=1 Tax=Dorea formicigenerans TaxID=39486 RepID=UPI0032C07CF7